MKHGLTLVVLGFLILAGAVSPAMAKTSRVVFENGMEVIFKENHSSPMITSIVFVRAGAKYENDFNNGVTHLLEHLLFDGTQNRSREDISEGIKGQGGYINAFTRKDMTGYLVLMPKENIEYGLEVQADQLFNSIFPEEELPKERKVVIEEIQKDNDVPSSRAEDFFNAQSMAGTAYERPVLGYKNIIASIPRERIIEYWKDYYAPNNMIGLVIGDFETEEMVETYRSVFGIIPPANLPSPPVVNYFAPKEQKVETKAGKTDVTYLSVGIDAPHFTDPDYFAFDLLTEYLNLDGNSPIQEAAVDETGKPLYQSLSAELETAEEYSRLIIRAETDSQDKARRILSSVEDVLENFEEYKPSSEILDGIKVSKKANEIYLQEKLHYYGFMIAPMLVITGWEFMDSYDDALGVVNPTMIVRAADRWLKNLNYTATIYYPKPKESGSEDNPEKNYTQYRKEILANGLTVVVKSNPDSRVFALNVIGKNRTASEPPGKIGITDFVNRMIDKGTTLLPEGELSQKLASIGAQVTLCDIPWIPYDDFYTTRQYSFMKFETIDDFTEEGLALFADMIRNPAFDSAAIENVRGMMMGVLGKQSGSTLDAGRNLFYKTLFEGAAYARPIVGTPRTIGSITRDDLLAHHARFYSPGNMIITVGTNRDADTMMAMIRNTFGDMQPVDFVVQAPQAGPVVEGVKEAHKEMDKEQVYIFLGNMLPSAGAPDVPAITLAAAVLSSRLQLQLREKEGLAYSVGAGTTFDRDFGWYSCAMGTGVGNFERARDGILEEMTKLAADGPTRDELETACNGLWGHMLTRRLSRINQAYYMGVNEYLGLGYDYDEEFIKQLRSVTADQVQAAAAKYFSTDNFVIATAGKM